MVNVKGSVDCGEGGDYCRVVGDDDMLVSCDIGIVFLYVMLEVILIGLRRG